MTRINTIDTTNAPQEAKDLLDGVKAQLGMVPNIFATMAHAPAALDGFLKISGALGEGKLSPALREQIALTMAGQNSCDYCASAHTLMGQGAGLAQDELFRGLKGQSSDQKAQAALTFVKAVVGQRGNVVDAELEAVRAAGYSDGEIIEMIAHVGVNTFTNYFNHIAGTKIDFPFVNAA